MSGNEVKIVHYGERGQGAVVVEKKNRYCAFTRGSIIAYYSANKTKVMNVNADVLVSAAGKISKLHTFDFHLNLNQLEMLCNYILKCCE